MSLNKTLRFVAAFSLLLGLSSFAHAELIGFWRLDGTLEDSSGQGNHGEPIGEPIFDDDVPEALGAGQSMLFDGDDAILLGNADVLNFGTNDWTISAWAKRELETAGRNIYGNGGDNGGGVRTVLAIGESANASAVVLTTDVNEGTGAKVQADSSDASSFPEIVSLDGEWNHVAGVRAGDEIRVYVNGELADVSPLRTDPPYDLSGSSQLPAYIGVGASAASDPIGAFEKWFTGRIDEVSVWDEALNDDSISFIADGGGIAMPENPGDFNQDGVVDLGDFSIMSENFFGNFSREESHSKGDFNVDLVVDLRDFIGFRQVFLSAGNGGATAVPEPSSFALISLGLLIAASRRRPSRV